MNYLQSLVLILGVIIVSANKEKAEELLKQAKSYYHISPDSNELKQSIFGQAQEDQSNVHKSQSMFFANLNRKYLNQTTQNGINSSNPNSTYNYTYSSKYPETANYYTYSNSTNDTNTTNTTNATYPNSTYNYNNQSYNYSYTQPQSTSPQYIYSNQSNTTNDTNNTNTTNSTYYNQSQLNTTRPRVEQSKINLKLRKQLNLNQRYNLTQNVTFYNSTTQQYDTIVLFNETQTTNRNTPNQYYYYQNSKLVTLTKEYDRFGNNLYRSLQYNFTLVVAGNSTNGSYKNTNAQVFGTIVQGNHSLNGSYISSNNTNYVGNNPYNSQYGSVGTSSNGNFNFANGSGTFQNTKMSGSYESNSQNQIHNLLNGSINYQENYQEYSQSSSTQELEGQADLNQNISYSYNNFNVESKNNQSSNYQDLSIWNNEIQRHDNYQGSVNQNKQSNYNNVNGEEVLNTQLIFDDQFSNNSDASVNFINRYASKSLANSKSDDINLYITENPTENQENYSIQKIISSEVSNSNSTTVGQETKSQNINVDSSSNGNYDFANGSGSFYNTKSDSIQESNSESEIHNLFDGSLNYQKKSEERVSSSNTQQLEGQADLNQNMSYSYIFHFRNFQVFYLIIEQQQNIIQVLFLIYSNSQLSLNKFNFMPLSSIAISMTNPKIIIILIIKIQRFGITTYKDQIIIKDLYIKTHKSVIIKEMEKKFQIHSQFLVIKCQIILMPAQILITDMQANHRLTQKVMTQTFTLLKTNLMIRKAILFKRQQVLK